MINYLNCKTIKLPIVSSNIYKNGKRVFDPSTTVTKNNVRYGIVGVTTPETKLKRRLLLLKVLNLKTH